MKNEKNEKKESATNLFPVRKVREEKDTGRAAVIGENAKEKGNGTNHVYRRPFFTLSVYNTEYSD